MTGAASSPSAELPGWQRALTGAAVSLFRRYVCWLGRLPMPTAYRVARALVPVLLAAQRRTQRQNLARYFGADDLPAAGLQELTRAISRYEARIHVHFSRLSTLSRDELRDWITLRGMDHLDQALALGRGVILVTDHAGTSWLSVPVLLAARGYPVHMVANPMSAPGVDSWLSFVAQRFGADLAFVGRGVPARARRALAHNHIFCVTFDVAVVLERGEWLPFGSATIPVDPGPAILASRFGAPVLQATSAHEPDWGLSITIHPPTAASTPSERPADPVDLCRHWLTRLEAQIAERPAEWWPWSYVGLGASPPDQISPVATTAGVPRARA